MNEIIVKVTQKPGVVSLNFEEIKTSLEAELKRFESTVYDDDSIKTAKDDLAELRKLAKTIEDRRKEVKNKCLEPYNEIEPQVKELVELINKPINAINTQVQDYEKRRKEKVRAEIDAYWKQKVTSLPECIWGNAHERIYDTSWENASATKKSWREGIDAGIQSITADIDTIKSFESKYENEILEVFYKSLSLNDAIRKMNDLNAQEKRILEMQRLEKERAEREAAEKEARERRLAEQSASNMVLPKEEPNQDVVKGENKAIQEVKQKNITPTTKTPELVQEESEIVLKIIGTDQQIEKIKNYINFTGASFREV